MDIAAAVPSGPTAVDGAGSRDLKVGWLPLNPAWAVGIIGVALSAAAYLGVARYWDAPAAQRQVDMISENHRLLVQSGLLDFEEAIDTVSSRVGLAGGRIDRNAFVPFADQLRHNFVDLGSIAWIPRIEREARAVHEASAVGQGLSRYRITERGADGHLAVAADRAEYFPLFYVSGEPTDLPVAGLDLETDPVVRAAIDEAWGGEWRIASGLFGFETASGPKSAVVLLEPVYLSNLPRRTAQDRRRALAGFVAGILDPGMLLDRIPSEQEIDIYLFEAKAGPRDLPVRVHSSLLRNRPAPVRPRAELEAQMHWTGNLSIADALFTMIVVPIPGAPLLIASGRARIIFFTGLLLTVAGTIYVAFARRALARVKEARNQLSFSHLLLDTAMQATPDGMLIVDAQMRVVSSNQRFREIFQVPEAIIASKDDQPLLQFVTSCAEHPDEFVARVRYLYQHPEEVAHEDVCLRDERVLDRHSVSLFSDDHRYLGRIWFFRDVTEERRAERRLTALARVDSLTGLANRSAFLERLHQAFAASRRGGAGFTLLALDLDHFKQINDSLGHPAGDAVLIEAGKRLRSAVRETDVVARPGGDEFAILLANAADADGAAAVAAKLRSLLAEPYRVAASDAHATASIGISVYSPKIETPAQMLERADRALYRAKHQGRDRYCFYSPELDRVEQSEEIGNRI